MGNSIPNRLGVGNGPLSEQGDVGDGRLQTIEGLTAFPTAGQMATHAGLSTEAELPVAKIVQTSTGSHTGTVTNHPQQLHIPFDAGNAVNDPPRHHKPEDPSNELQDFGALVQRYEYRVRTVVARFLDDDRDIDEAVQDMFVQAWRHRSEFRSEAAVFTWLYRIASNAALMRLRRHHHPTVTYDDLDPTDHLVLSHDPLDDHSEHLALVDEVRTALAELPEHHRIVVILRDVEGHSNAEVANLLGLPVTTVKAQLHRGRAALRLRLHP